MNNNDKNTWDISFPEVSDSDLVLWSSWPFSDGADKATLTDKFLSEVEQGNYKISGYTSTKLTPEDKEWLKLQHFDKWEARWLAYERYEAAEDELLFIDDTMYGSDVCFKSALVLCIVRGWTPDGVGHMYSVLKATSPADIIAMLRDSIIRKSSLSVDEDHLILVPSGGTLSYQYLSTPLVESDGSIFVDENGSEIYENGTMMEFYHVKPSFVSMFNKLISSDAEKKVKRGTSLNVFCETFIQRNGKELFIEYYLDKIDQPIRHIWLGEELDKYWDVGRCKNKK